MTFSSVNRSGDACASRNPTVRTSVSAPARATRRFSPSANGTSNIATPPSGRLVPILRPLTVRVTDGWLVKTGTGCVQRPEPSSAPLRFRHSRLPMMSCGVRLSTVL